MCNTFATIWDNLHSKMTKDDKGQQQGDTLQPFAMSYAILQYSTVLPFTFLTSSVAFGPFVTFLDFAFSILHLIVLLFPVCFIRPFSHDYCTIVSAFWVLFQADQPCALLMFCISFDYYNCTYVSCYHHYQIQQRVPPSTIL